MKKAGAPPYYVVLGIRSTDPGFSAVAGAMESLGCTRQLGTAFWQLQTSTSFEEAFRQINTSMLDRRIDSGTALLLLDPAGHHAKWHLRQPLSDLILSQWQFQNNLLISFSIKNGTAKNVTAKNDAVHNPQFIDCMTRLGTWAPLSKHLWYISTTCRTREAFGMLADTLQAGDEISVLDSAGNIATWQQWDSTVQTQARHDRASTGMQRLHEWVAGKATKITGKTPDGAQVEYEPAPARAGGPTNRLAMPKKTGIIANHIKTAS